MQEGGGQVEISGVLLSESTRRKDLYNGYKKENGLIVHFTNTLPVQMEGTFEAKVDVQKRLDTENNHSATHLLHAALKEVLGTHVNQKGSLSCRISCPKERGLNAGTIVRELAKEINGGGGGQPFFATAGGDRKTKSAGIGQPAPLFEAYTPQNKLVKLSDYKGKYTLVDFWASWCAPCRQENPNIVKQYHAFKDKGFDVLGVSLDNNPGPWMRAIADDKLE
ncbi:hypothetical protein FQR65_LT18696 [Abscondita terminalis]|nr:hypothetical protein FQR65_LT18696 [Abscondita terminalis]